VIPMRALLIAPALLLAAAVTHAQSPTPARPPAEDLRKLCETISMNPADGREMARRAECVLSGVLPSPNRLAEARALSRSALAAGEPLGGLMLYLTFQADPANRYLEDGKPDPQAYAKLAARPIAQRQEQIDAIDGLGNAAGKNNVAAGVLLAGYFHQTVAPRNVSRLGALAALLGRNGEHGPFVERYAREADAIAKTAASTKTSVRNFFETYQQAVPIARSAYAAQSGGKSCEQAELKAVSSGDIQGAEFLPLQGTLVKDSYLVKGQWTEYWTFQACDQEVPLKVSFAADGWGGATATVRHNKGD
jgi:hypothetical protein